MKSFRKALRYIREWIETVCVCYLIVALAAICGPLLIALVVIGVLLIIIAACLIVVFFPIVKHFRWFDLDIISEEEQDEA